MPPNDLTFSLDATGAEIDCLHWLEDFEREPEPLTCISHEHELPCRQCERGRAVVTSPTPLALHTS